MKTAAVVMVLLAMTNKPASAQSGSVDPLRVSIDGSCWFCDRDNLRREITWVNYVRDQSDAQVHILGTNQESGGGTEFTIRFIGVNELTGQETILSYNSSRTNTDAERREGVTRILTIGLLQYSALVDAIPDFTVSFEDVGPADAPVQEQNDPWDFWVFSVRAGGNLRGETRQSSYSVDGRVSADRVTEDWKLEFDASARYSRSETELTDSIFVNDSRNSSVEALLVKSITDHWSVGVQTEVRSSTFSNEKLKVNGGAAIEYSVFPYAESSTRQLTVLYRVGPVYFNWEDITIFDQTEEFRFEQDLLASFGMVQQWGSANIFGRAHSFLHDIKLHNLRVGGGLNFRVTRGLTVGLNGSVARIKDQISLLRGNISDADILVRRRQLGTDYRYSMRFNLTYRFGSIFSNVVNPRFDF